MNILWFVVKTATIVIIFIDGRLYIWHGKHIIFLNKLAFVENFR